jgi:hypothetical protein
MEHLTFQSFDEYSAAVQHADIRLTLSSREQTYWALDYLSFGDMSVQWGQDAGPNVVEGSSSAGGLTLFIPQSNANSILGNGCRMGNGSVMVLEPGVEFCIAATSVNRWSSIFVPYDQIAALGVTVAETKRAHSVLSPTEAGKRLRMLIENLGIASDDVPDALWLSSAATATRRKIAESVGTVLGFRSEVATTRGRHVLSR